MRRGPHRQLVTAAERARRISAKATHRKATTDDQFRLPTGDSLPSRMRLSQRRARAWAAARSAEVQAIAVRNSDDGGRKRDERCSCSGDCRRPPRESGQRSRLPAGAAERRPRARAHQEYEPAGVRIDALAKQEDALS